MTLVRTVMKAKGPLSLWATLIAVVAVVAAGLFIPLSAYAATPTDKLGDITQTQVADGKEVLIYNGSKVLYDNGGTLECKSPEDADFDSAKATFTLRYAATSKGTNNKNQQATANSAALHSADHYNVIAPSGLHLTMGNEDNNTAGNVKLSLRDDAFLTATNVDYSVNVAGGALGGWRGMGKIYSDRFSTDGVNQWFGLNATDNKSTLLPKGLNAATSPCGETGFDIYELPDPVTPTPTPSPSPTTPEPTAPAPTPTTPTPTPTPSEDPTDTTTIDVHDENGNPIVGAIVTVICGDKEVASYTTDGKEKTVVLDEGECLVHVETPDGYDDPADTPAVPNGTTEITVHELSCTETYVNWDGTFLFDVTYKFHDPRPAIAYYATRPDDANNTYDFSGWIESNDGKCDATYKADYTATPKQDVTVEIVDSVTGDRLDGTVDIYDSEGNKVAEAVKSGDVIKLPAGDYTAKQSGNIDGYDKAADKSFTVTDTAETVTLEAKNKPSEVTITVVDITDHSTPVDVTASVVCDGVSVPATVTRGKVVFNAERGECTVTLSAENFEPQNISVTVPGNGEKVAKTAEMRPSAAVRSAQIDGAGTKNNKLNNAVPTVQNVKSLSGVYGANGVASLSHTGGAAGIGLTAAAMLLLVGIFFVAKRRSES